MFMASSVVMVLVEHCFLLAGTLRSGDDPADGRVPFQIPQSGLKHRVVHSERIFSECALRQE
jgi:hypothetical protein